MTAAGLGLSVVATPEPTIGEMQIKIPDNSIWSFYYNPNAKTHKQ
jgi:hypothetical protein